MPFVLLLVVFVYLLVISLVDIICSHEERASLHQTVQFVLGAVGTVVCIDPVWVYVTGA